MTDFPLHKKISYIYLCVVPVLTIALAFLLGHISYTIYIPIWILNFCIMALAVWVLGAKILRGDERENRFLAAGGCLLIFPICLLSILFGMGAPPDTMEEWVTTATEQKLRFDILLADGILVALGLSVIKLVLNERGEKLLVQLGYTAIIIAIPLFFINTSFWHSYAQEVFRIRLAHDKKPLEWYAPQVQQIWVITIGQVLLTYFAAAMFVGSLRRTHLFKKRASLCYILFSVIAIVSILLFPLYPGAAPFSGFPYYPFMIPAVPIMLCYYMGVNLVKNAGMELDRPVRELRVERRRRDD